MAEDKDEIPKLDWIQLHNELQEMHQQHGAEGTLEKMKRRTRENPFVPFGCLATVCALSYGLWNFRKGNQKMSQYMMRTRIVAQGFTIIAFVTGVGLAASREAIKDIKQ